MGHFVSSVSAVGFALALWTGAYLTTARGRERGTGWAAASQFCLALYFLHAVLCLHVPAVHAGFLWRRFLGWSVLPFLALWVHATVDTAEAPRARWGRLLLFVSSGAAAGLSGLWLLGSWTFASTLLQPVELRVPVAVYGLVASGLAAGAWASSPDSPRGLARALALVSVAWGLGTAVLPAVRHPGISAAAPVLAGHGVTLLGLGAYGLLVAHSGLFVGGAAAPRDFLHNLAASAFLVVVYGGFLVISTRLAASLRFDPLALSAVVVLGLVIVTHLLVDEIRSAWDRLFFPQLATLRKHLRSLSSQLTRDDRVAVGHRLVMDLRETLGARWAALVLSDGARPGSNRIWGFAWSPFAKIQKVEYAIVRLTTLDDWRRVDPADRARVTWQRARLSSRQRSEVEWVRFEFDWNASPGLYGILTRATDEKGNAQPLELPKWNKLGYGWNRPVAHPVQVG